MKKILFILSIIIIVSSFSYAVTINIRRGESILEEITVSVPQKPANVDIVFALASNISSYYYRESLQGDIDEIVSGVHSSLPDANVMWAVCSFNDYPHSYTNSTNCGYDDACGDPNTSCYGLTGDYAYKLDQDFTADANNIISAINSVEYGNGKDWPGSLTRVLYEANQLSWRNGSYRLLYVFNTNLPHDCHIDHCDQSWFANRGGDPGRDEIMNTSDDLDFQDTIADLVSNKINIIMFTSNNDKKAFFYCLFPTINYETTSEPSTLLGTIPTGDYNLVTLSNSDFSIEANTFADQNIPESGKDYIFEFDMTLPKDNICCKKSNFDILGDGYIIHSITIKLP